MFKTVHKHWIDRRRRRRTRFLREIRHQFETCGYSVSEISDSDLETALTYMGPRTEKTAPLTARSAFWTLRRLSPDVSELRRREENGGKSTNES